MAHQTSSISGSKSPLIDRLKVVSTVNSTKQTHAIASFTKSAPASPRKIGPPIENKLMKERFFKAIDQTGEQPQRGQAKNLKGR